MSRQILKSNSPVVAFASQVYAVQPSKFRCNTEALADNAFMDTEIDCESAQFDRQVLH